MRDEKGKAGEEAEAAAELGASDSMAIVMSEVYSLLDDIEWCIDLTAETGKDVYACPVCKGRYLLGVGGEHAEGCRFDEIFRKIESIVCA